MSISASHIVQMSSRVISGGSSDLETNGMLLTKSALIPTSQPAMLFSSAEAVADMFGATSKEAVFAQQYFVGCTNQQKAVSTLVIGRRIDEDVPAWIRGGQVAADLAAFKAVTDGTLTITINGEAKSVQSLDLSEATSLSEVAVKVAEALTGVTGSYDSNLKSFTFTTEKTGSDATIGYAAATEASLVGAGIVGEALALPQTGGTDLAAMLCLTQAAGAVLSQGAAAKTETEDLNSICTVTRNWVGFTTLWEAEKEEAEAFAAWADASGDDYCYFDWSLDDNMTNQLTQAGTKAQTLMNTYNCACTIYGDAQDAAFVMGVGASIAWTRTQGMKTWFAKTASGITPRVTNESVADALEAIRCNYTGEFATRNAAFNFFNRGTLTSTQYGFIDVLYGSIYIRNALQRSCMDGFKNTNRVPYNASGAALIRAWTQDPINVCKNNGAIDDGLELSESQKQQILQETNDETVSQELFTKGCWLGITMPSANLRADRQSPVLTLYYTYGGSVHRLDFEVTVVI